MCVCRARDYSAPVNFISAGLKKGAAEEADSEDSDAEEKPVKQEDFPKDLGPKKLKTVGSEGWSPKSHPLEVTSAVASSTGRSPVSTCVCAALGSCSFFPPPCH